MDPSGRRPYRSIFWPILLIGVGVLWLLGNYGLIPVANLSLLFSLWPLVLVFIGLDMLIGRSSPVLSGLVALLMVALAVGLVLAGPALGIRPPGGEFKVENFTAPADNVASVEYRINSASEAVEIRALSGSDALINATIGHYGQMRFDAGSGENRVVVLEKISGTSSFNFNLANLAEHRWDIGINGRVPTTLRLDSGSGSVNMDLSGVTLTGMELDSGSGSVNMTLPTTEKEYAVAVDSGSGSVSVDLPADTTVTLRLSTGSGSASLDLPAGAAVRVEVRDGGSGAVNIASTLERLEGDRNEDEGVWQTQGYEAAAHQILIILENMGSGSINID